MLLGIIGFWATAYYATTPDCADVEE